VGILKTTIIFPQGCGDFEMTIKIPTNKIQFYKGGKWMF
jgi:hypothetical protein